MTSISKNKERFGNSNQKDAITATKSTAIFSDVETRQATASVFGGRLSLIYYNIKAIWGQSQTQLKTVKKTPQISPGYVKNSDSIYWSALSAREIL